MTLGGGESEGPVALHTHHGPRGTALRRVAASVALLVAVAPSACTSPPERLQARGVIVGVEARVPQRPASITVRTDGGVVLRLRIDPDRSYGFTVEQLYEWVDAHRHVTVTYSRRDGSYILGSIAPAAGGNGPDTT